MTTVITIVIDFGIIITSRAVIAPQPTVFWQVLLTKQDHLVDIAVCQTFYKTEAIQFEGRS